MEEGWWHRAACKGMPLEMFFPEAGQTAVAAKNTCLRCPVRDQCLNEAVSVEQAKYRHGVWGGMSKNDREVEFDGRKPPEEKRTKCINGHELTPENTINHGRGRRRCKECDISPEVRKLKFENRTECKRGHEWTDENVVTRGRRKLCRICERDNSRNHAQRVKEQHEAASNHHQRQQVRQAV